MAVNHSRWEEEKADLILLEVLPIGAAGVVRVHGLPRLPPDMPGVALYTVAAGEAVETGQGHKEGLAVPGEARVVQLVGVPLEQTQERWP
jgi:hypothetical protein